MAPQTFHREFISAGMMLPVASASAKMGFWSAAETAAAEAANGPVKLPEPEDATAAAGKLAARIP